MPRFDLNHGTNVKAAGEHTRRTLDGWQRIRPQIDHAPPRPPCERRSRLRRTRARARKAAIGPRGPFASSCPSRPAAPPDPVARLLAAKVSDNTGWQTVIDNKPGAAGAIGAAIVAKKKKKRRRPAA